MGTKKRRIQTPRKISDETPPLGPGVEFRHAEDDDAWYNVQLVLQRETFIVKFTEFPEDQDVVFQAADFSTSDEIFNFSRRFRPLSSQLEASDCPKVKLGMRVCAIRDLGDQGRRFFDAIVESVKHKEHTIVDGTENCICFVVLSWLHGPESGTLTSARVEDLCLIESHKQLDPRLACFLELAKWKHGIASYSPKLITEDLPTSFQCKPGSSFQISEGRRQIVGAELNDEGNFGFESNEDADLGGDLTHAKERKYDHHYIHSLDKLVENVSNVSLGAIDNVKTEMIGKARYFVVVDNLEKDVSPSTIMDFVQEATGLKIEAFVFTSLSSEPYTRGALLVDSDEDHEILCNFLVKPEQMITSSKGRPWIVSDSSAIQSVRPFWRFEPDLKTDRQQSAGDGLKVVKVGSDDYSKAEKLKDLFQCFTDHQQKLFKRLLVEEQLILNA